MRHLMAALCILGASTTPSLALQNCDALGVRPARMLVKHLKCLQQNNRDLEKELRTLKGEKARNLKDGDTAILVTSSGSVWLCLAGPGGAHLIRCQPNGEDAHRFVIRRLPQ